MASGDRTTIGDGHGDSGGSHFVFAYYLTGGCGSGHATRAVELVTHLLATGNCVHLVTAAPDFELTDHPRLYTRKVDRVVIDCVALEREALTAHSSASKAAVPRSSIVKREAEWLKSVRADAVMLNPWDVDEISFAADVDTPMGNVLFDWEPQGVRGRQQLRQDLNRPRNAFLLSEGVHDGELTPSPRPRLKRSRNNSLPPSPTPAKSGHQRRSTSSPPSPHRSKGAPVPTGIFWDIENCKVPVDSKAEDIPENIRKALRTIPDVDSTAVIQSYGRVARSIVEVLQRTGVRHVGTQNRKKDAADKLILVDLFKFTCDHPTPACVLLITGDSDFAPVVRLLEKRGYTVVIALPEEATTASVLYDAGSYMWDWPSLARGEGIVIRRRVGVNIEALKAEMVLLYQSKDGYIDMGGIHSEYTKMFGKQITLSDYNAVKMVDLFQKMGDPFSIEESKIVFTAQATPSATAPSSVGENSSLSMETAQATSVTPPERDVNFEVIVSGDATLGHAGDATPSVRRNRWDETQTPGMMADADAMPAALGVSPGATPSGAWDATPKLPGGVTPIPGKKQRSRWDEMHGEFKCSP